MIPQNLIDIISPAGWGGMAIMVVWNYFTTKKKRNAEVEASNLVNMQKVIDTVSSFNDKLEEKIEKIQKRVGALEQTLRKQEFDHQEQIKQIQEDHRTELQKTESYYREKCRQCEHQKPKGK